MAALGFEPPPLGRGPDAIPLDQCVVFTIITKPNDDFVCKKIKIKIKKKVHIDLNFVLLSNNEIKN